MLLQLLAIFTLKSNTNARSFKEHPLPLWRTLTSRHSVSHLNSDSTMSRVIFWSWKKHLRTYIFCMFEDRQGLKKNSVFEALRVYRIKVTYKVTQKHWNSSRYCEKLFVVSSIRTHVWCRQTRQAWFFCPHLPESIHSKCLARAIFSCLTAICQKYHQQTSQVHFFHSFSWFDPFILINLISLLGSSI